jgi:acetamidase/formamidase
MHTVESTTDTVRSGYLDSAAEPVATIAPGDTVRYPNTWTHWGNEAKFGMSFADREPLRHRYPPGPYSMLGPVQVTGAEPGDVVEVSITRLRTIGWGWNSFPLVASWDEHLRQHERVTKREQAYLERVRELTDPDHPVIVTHWLASSRKQSGSRAKPA